MFAMRILLFCTMLMAASHLRSISQNFTESGFLISSMLRIAKNHSYSDVAMNPRPVMLGSVNTRSIRNTGLLLADTIASHTFDFLCLIETHICTTDSDSFLCSLMPDRFSLIDRPRSFDIGGGVGFFIHDSYKYCKVDTLNYRSFENIVISVSLSCRTLLLASIYRPPGPCSSIF